MTARKPYRINKYLRWILVMIMISECQSIAEIDNIEFEPAMVMNFIMSDDPLYSFSHIKLYSEKSILDNTEEAQPISGASLELFENSRKVADAEEINIGVYKFDYTPKANKTYLIKGHKEGYEDIYSEDISPSKTSTIAIKELTPFPKDNFARKRTYRLTYLLDDSHEKNYYDLQLYVRYSDGTRHTLQSIRTRQIGVAIELGMIGDTTRVFTDDLFNGERHLAILEFDLENRDNQKSRKTELILNLKHTSEAYYNYYRSLESQANAQENPFTEPAQVFSNIQNGYGIFAVYLSDSTVLPIK